MIADTRWCGLSAQGKNVNKDGSLCCIRESRYVEYSLTIIIEG